MDRSFASLRMTKAELRMTKMELRMTKVNTKMTKMKSIIITPTWNKLELLKPFLGALIQQKDKDFGVIIVDNGSEDGSRDFLIELAKSIKEFPLWVLLLKENAGFALPNNLGITFATEFLEFQYIILLNNDTIPSPNFTEVLHNKAESYLNGFDRKNFDIDKKLFPFLSLNDRWRIGSFTPLVENFFARGRVDAAGIKISPDGNAINRGVGEKIFKYNREKEVFGPSGSAALHLRKALLDVALTPQKIATFKGWEKVDLKEGKIWSVSLRNAKKLQVKLSSDYQYLPIKEFFSSRYFAYFEDVDLAWRLRLRHWGSVYIPGAKILHYHSATAKAYSPFKSYLVHRNQYFNIIRDFPGRFVYVGFWNAFKRYFLLLKSMRVKKGPTAMVAKNSSKIKVFFITIKGWGSVLRNLTGLIKERMEIQADRIIDTEEFTKLINCARFRASFDKMIFETHDFLRGRKKTDAKYKDQIDRLY
jgi:GT2 family glycosyltransferase